MTEAKKTPRKPRITPSQWAEAEAQYALGTATIAMLVKKLGCTRTGVYLHMEKKKIVQGSKAAEHTKKVAEAMEAVTLTDASIIAARIKETKEDHYKMASGLAKLTWAEVLKTKQDGVPVANAFSNLRALDAAMTVLKKAREERWAVLGLDKDTYVDEDSLPELVISELTLEQVQKMRDRADESMEPLPEDLEVVEDLEDDGIVST